MKALLGVPPFLGSGAQGEGVFMSCSSAFLLFSNNLCFDWEHTHPSRQLDIHRRTLEGSCLMDVGWS